jgi:hypothetical protein
VLEEKILKEFRNVAVVGISADPYRPSCRVADYLMKQGYHIFPVNPNTKEVLGKPTYPDLSSIPEPVEIVNIFRRSESVMPIVDEAIKIGAKVIWMQEGIVNQEAATKARNAGLLVVMDKCIRKEHSAWLGSGQK